MLLFDWLLVLQVNGGEGTTISFLVGEKNEIFFFFMFRKIDFKYIFGADSYSGNHYRLFWKLGLLSSIAHVGKNTKKRPINIENG